MAREAKAWMGKTGVGGDDGGRERWRGGVSAAVQGTKGVGWQADGDGVPESGPRLIEPRDGEGVASGVGGEAPVKLGESNGVGGGLGNAVERLHRWQRMTANAARQASARAGDLVAQ